MKIIAKTASCFLVEATKDELAQVMGYHSSYGMKDEGRAIEIGNNINVSKLYSALSTERSRQKEVAELAAALRRTADKVDAINAALDCPIVEPSA